MDKDWKKFKEKQEKKFTEKHYPLYKKIKNIYFSLWTMLWFLAAGSLATNTFFTESNIMGFIGFIAIIAIVISLIVTPLIYDEQTNRDIKSFQKLENSLFEKQKNVEELSQNIKEKEERLQEIISELKEKDIKDIRLDDIQDKSELSWDLCRPYFEDKELMFTLCDYFSIGGLIQEIEKLKFKLKIKKDYIKYHKGDYYEDIKWAQKQNDLLKKIKGYLPKIQRS